jgi:protein involved in polysaccharide export with SLBB domain
LKLSFRFLVHGSLLAVVAAFAGCETKSYMDPSRTGYFETTPTSIPILSRIDVIEQAADSSIEYTQPTPEDLVPNQLEYRLAPGDVMKVSIPQLISSTETDVSTRVVDQAGKISLPIIGQVQAAGLTVQEIEKEIVTRLAGVITNPKAFISVEEARAYQFRILGSVEAPGLYALNKPDLRVLDALALARGAVPSTTRILVTRAKANDAQYESDYGGRTGAQKVEPAAGAKPATKTEAPVPQEQPKPVNPAPPSGADIEALINELPGAAAAPAAAPAPAPAPAAEPAAAPAAAPTSEPAPSAEPATQPATQPGMLSSRARQAPPVDIDQLEPAKASDTAAADIAAQSTEEGDRFTFDNATQTWVKVKHADAKAPAASKVTADTATAPASAPAPAAGTATDAAVPGLRTGDAARARGRAKVDEKKAFSSRVIEVDYNQLVRGAANLNVIIRPNDMLYCDTGEVGVVYIGGEIARPGVYNLPTSGKLTLSRLVDAAGGLGQIAIPQRVDLIRRIGGDKEAAIRVNLAAIRNRAEPDIFMKSDDHVIIGTNFWATPLAVIRNGFRMTYGFGFLIDRNFGNDVFGPPPYTQQQ